MDPDWSIWVHDLKTGAPIAPLTVKLGAQGDSWSTGTSGNGTSTTTIVMDEEDPWTPAYTASLLKPNDRMIVRWWGVNGGADPGDAPMYAHKIEDWAYSLDGDTITVTSVDLLGETKWRMIGGADSDKHLTLTVTNRTPSGAVAQVMARMMQWSPDWQYPLDLPADAPGTFKGGPWVFWEGRSMGEILDEIRKRAGVEIYLRPYATASGGIRFQVRVGSPVTIGGANFNLLADESPLSGITYRVDGAQQVTGLLGLGNGTGEDQETAHQDGTVKIAIRDTKKSFDDLTGDALQEAVDTYYYANVDPIIQWDIGAFTIGGGYEPEHSAPGRVFNVELYGNPVIPDGVHTLRVINVSGDNGPQLKPEVQGA
ncbi:hypothetical protein [Microbacterium sp. BH-3-3-3]|uniref:hypothetical protein n=1 Tax=Microbacterium sp. BH-3-3-3 TaxID=1906742 RepID=UPI00119CDB1E|nr:hypothetical protein [Microbacterium sp. BH-3-3-3]